MKKSVHLTTNGVNIAFSGDIEKNKIITMVQNCSTGQCECMSDTTKQKITNMEVSGSDGDVNLTLTGDLTQKEIEEALSKSKVL